MRIGIDFDNTIAWYDKSFRQLALEENFIKTKKNFQKKELKQIILKQKNGSKKWMKLQGMAYGKYMKNAKIFPNFINFLILCRIRNYEIFIISHKTKFGHFDENKISLRDEALKWMTKNNFFKKNYLNLNKKNIFFANTREEKINKINELKCDWFIDDLIEVLKNKRLKTKIKKIYFCQKLKNYNSEKIRHLYNWTQIRDQILGKISIREISIFLNIITKIKFTKLERVYGRGNSVIYKGWIKKKKYAIKFYPDLLTDSRKRLVNEFEIIKQLNEKNFNNIPKNFYKNEDLNIGIFEWIEGKNINIINNEDLNKAIKFITKLENLSKEKNTIKAKLASDACLSGKELINQIENRIKRLNRVKKTNPELNSFFLKTFLPLWKRIKKRYYKLWPITSKKNSLENDKLTLSPSDFGFHNSLKKNNKIFFLDFEYFGWDDPVKLTADFIWHPSNIKNKDILKKWKENMIKLFSNDKEFEIRLNASLPLYGIRWIVIILNEFLPEYSTRRKLARNSNLYEQKKEKSLQIKKALYYCKKINNF